MIPKSPLPLDILEYIASSLGSGGNPDTKTLGALSRTCKSMVPLAQKHLFSSLYINEKDESQSFSGIIASNPNLILYVRHLTYAIEEPINDNNYQILECLRERSLCLQSLELWSSFHSDWNSFPMSLQASLEDLIQLPSLTYLRFRHFKRCPTIIFAKCFSLKHLALDEITMIPPGPSQALSLPKIPAPKPQILSVGENASNALAALMEPTGNGVVIDFSHLGRAELTYGSPEDAAAIEELLENTKRLHTLQTFADNDYHVVENPPRDIVGLGRRLLIHVHRTLKKIIFQPMVEGDDHAPLFGLNTELGIIAGHDTLETFELDVTVNTDCEMQIEATEDWSVFDALLTTPGAFPALGHVSVKVEWFLAGLGPEDVVHRLRKEHFPRLLGSDTLEFEFSAGYLNV